jgi:transcriptional regulator with GAF, ATPase, and Fis domain
MRSPPPEIDWEYDIRSTLESSPWARESSSRAANRAGSSSSGPRREARDQAGWKADDVDLFFSRTVVSRPCSGKRSLREREKDDPRFMEAESIKHLETLSLISVPLRFEVERIGALYIESKSPRNLFNELDLEFLKEFTDIIAPYLKTAMTHRDHLRAIRRLQEEVSDHYSFSSIIGKSASMRGVFDLVKIAADVDRTVLLTGESGSGKELIARAIHYNGPRRARPLLVVDCSSLSEHILESELFGHRRGAFTGASNDKVGAFEEADRGTIFLDEISDASKPLQQKLRRVLQEGEIRRVGENVTRKVDVRVICATNRNLGDLVEKGEFMRDLYFRINKFPIHIPPLRARLEDIPLLVDHFLEKAATESGAPPKTIHPGALERLMKRDWSENNVRELRNTVELAVDFSSDGAISTATLERVFQVQRGGIPPRPGPGAASSSAAGPSPPRTGGLVESTGGPSTGSSRKPGADPSTVPRGAGGSDHRGLPRRRLEAPAGREAPRDQLDEAPL